MVVLRSADKSRVVEMFESKFVAGVEVWYEKEAKVIAAAGDMYTQNHPTM
jgi:hypothetical protein